ncbi:MAG: hypothetical protein MJE68_22810 [Proteobacteria bacterium]|nr:hypothetical protein [Pseudomonadota bacterium]
MLNFLLIFGGENSQNQANQAYQPASKSHQPPSQRIKRIKPTSHPPPSQRFKKIKAGRGGPLTA